MRERKKKKERKRERERERREREREREREMIQHTSNKQNVWIPYILDTTRPEAQTNMEAKLVF